MDWQIPTSHNSDIEGHIETPVRHQTGPNHFVTMAKNWGPDQDTSWIRAMEAIPDLWRRCRADYGIGMDRADAQIYL